MTVPLAMAQIRDDLQHVAACWERKEDQVKQHGFLGVSKELVDTITKDKATDWGGGSYGDMMHFDMRTQGRGAIINKAFNEYKLTKVETAKNRYKSRVRSIPKGPRP